MQRRMSMAVAVLFVLAAAALSSCGGEVYAEGSAPEYPAQPYAATIESGGLYPPATYVATTEPVYYQGRPTYWYRDRWYYRDGGGWRSYPEEPRALNQQRVTYGAPARYDYGRPSMQGRGVGQGEGVAQAGGTRQGSAFAGSRDRAANARPMAGGGVPRASYGRPTRVAAERRR